MGKQEPKWAHILIKFVPVAHISLRHDICYNF